MEPITVEFTADLQYVIHQRIEKYLPTMNEFMHSLIDGCDSAMLYDKLFVEASTVSTVKLIKDNLWMLIIRILTKKVILEEQEHEHVLYNFLCTFFSEYAKNITAAVSKIILYYVLGKINASNEIFDLIIKYGITDRYIKMASAINLEYLFEHGATPMDKTFDTFIRSYRDKKLDLLQVFFRFFPETMVEKFEQFEFDEEEKIEGLKYWIANGANVNAIAPSKIVQILRYPKSKCAPIIDSLEESGYDFSKINDVCLRAPSDISSTLCRLGISAEAINSFYAHYFNEGSDCESE